MRKAKEIKEFTGKDIVSMGIRHSPSSSADIFIHFMKVKL